MTDNDAAKATMTPIADDRDALRAQVAEQAKTIEALRGEKEFYQQERRLVAAERDAALQALASRPPAPPDVPPGTDLVWRDGKWVGTLDDDAEPRGSLPVKSETRVRRPFPDTPTDEPPLSGCAATDGAHLDPCECEPLPAEPPIGQQEAGR